MNFLALVQALHYEAKLPGSAPSAVTGLSGRPADLVRWTVEAWHDIQRERDGKWKWMRAGFTLDTAIDTSSYEYGDCNDVDAGEEITRFRAWHLDDDEPPLIYLLSEGKETERELPLADWKRFRHRYVRATHTAAPPSYLAVDPNDRLHLGPKPDGVYRITGDYWRSMQTLALAEDEPEMPADFHMLIVYRAIVRYGYKVVAQEILAEAQTLGMPLWESLTQNQWMGRFELALPGSLA